MSDNYLEQVNNDPALLEVQEFLTNNKDDSTVSSMSDEVLLGQDVMERFNSLTPVLQFAVCMTTCSKLVNRLDTLYTNASSFEDVKVNPEFQELVNNVGSFLMNVPVHFVLQSSRKNIQIERIIKYEFDEHPVWKSLLSKVNSYVSTKYNM